MARPGKTAGYTNVPKFELMSVLRVALEQEELKIAKEHEGSRRAGAVGVTKERTLFLKG